MRITKTGVGGLTIESVRKIGSERMNQFWEEKKNWLESHNFHAGNNLARILKKPLVTL